MTRTLFCCLLLGLPLSGAAAEPAAFRFSKDVDRHAAKNECILSVAFDGDIYAATRAAFPDLRIFDVQGKEVPCLIERATEARTHAVRRPCTSRVVSLHEQEDGIEVIVQLGEKSPPADGLTIFTPLANYERRVRVFGSAEGSQWKPLTADGLVFDYARYMDISNHDVPLPKNEDRQLKIEIAGITDAKESPLLELTRKYHGGEEAERVEKTVLERRPFRIDRIELWHLVTETLAEEAKQAEYPLVAFHAAEDQAEKATIIGIQTRREPLTEFTLETSSRNFSRSASVQVPVEHGKRTDWVEIGQGKLSIVDFGGYHRQTLSISFPEHRESQYRLVIHDEDNPPLTVAGVRAGATSIAWFFWRPRTKSTASATARTKSSNPTTTPRPSWAPSARAMPPAKPVWAKKPRIKPSPRLRPIHCATY